MKTEFTTDELRKALKAYIETVGREEGIDFIDRMIDPEMERIVRTIDAEESSQYDVDTLSVSYGPRAPKVIGGPSLTATTDLLAQALKKTGQ